MNLFEALSGILLEIGFFQRTRRRSDFDTSGENTILGKYIASRICMLMARNFNSVFYLISMNIIGFISVIALYKKQVR
jgi:hypothetical protein